MSRIIVLFALVTTVLLSNASANPATSVEETAVTPATVVAEDQPEAAVAPLPIDTTVPAAKTLPATSPVEPAAEPTAAPVETK